MSAMMVVVIVVMVVMVVEKSGGRGMKSPSFYYRKIFYFGLVDFEIHEFQLILFCNAICKY